MPLLPVKAFLVKEMEKEVIECISASERFHHEKIRIGMKRSGDLIDDKMK